MTPNESLQPTAESAAAELGVRRTKSVPMSSSDQRVLAETWFYDGRVECGVEIWRRGLRPGTGDHEDPPEFRDDQPGEWYEVQFAPAGGGRMGQAGSGYHSTLEAAREHVRTLTNGTVHWELE